MAGSAELSGRAASPQQDCAYGAQVLLPRQPLSVSPERRGGRYLLLTVSASPSAFSQLRLQGQPSSLSRKTCSSRSNWLFGPFWHSVCSAGSRRTRSLRHSPTQMILRPSGQKAPRSGTRAARSRPLRLRPTLLFERPSETSPNETAGHPDPDCKAAKGEDANGEEPDRENPD